MVNQVASNVIGAVGGVILALCQLPQIIKLWRTKSAGDLSYTYIVLYTIGLAFICVYVRPTPPWSHVWPRPATAAAAHYGLLSLV